MLYELILALHLAVTPPQEVRLAEREFSLANRHEVESVNQVFKDNILLTLNYLDGRVKEKREINWDEVVKPGRSQFTLQPGQAFAFHEKTVKDYSQNVVKTTNANFIGQEGFKTDGYLFGDGVCHLASLLYWVAKDAGLTTYAPSDHNFAKINDVPKEYGVGILSPNPLGNLYILNNLSNPVTFVFDWDGVTLMISATTKAMES